MINLCKTLISVLKNNHLSPNAISHKDLKDLMIKAKKEIETIKTSGKPETIENQEFNDLVKDWRKKSKEILFMLNNKDQVFTKNTNPKSLMAFGAMGAHINMALQALKATESDQ